MSGESNRRKYGREFKLEAVRAGGFLQPIDNS
jgi:hypothetical protein